MTRSEKTQVCVAGIVLIALLSGILYFLYSLPPVIKFVPVKQALESLEAERRAKALEAQALKQTSLPPQPGTEKKPDSAK